VTVIDPLPVGVNLYDVLRDTNVGTGEYRQAINAYFAARGSATPVHNLTELIASKGYLGRLEKMYQESDQVGEMTYNPDYIGKIKARRLIRAHMTDLMERWQLDAFVYPHETHPVRTIADAVPNGGATAAPAARAVASAAACRGVAIDCRPRPACRPSRCPPASTLTASASGSKSWGSCTTKPR
jgi:hypothetical protein